MRIPVLYQDADIVVIDKPAGVPTHASDPADPYPGDALRAVQRQLGLPYLGMHQRLDAETSGVLLFAARREANPPLAAAFAGRSVQKVYLALVRGLPPKDQGTIDAPIVREHGDTYQVAKAGDRRARSAVTHYRLLRRDANGWFSLLEVRPESGRSHQIRVHLAHVGVPVVGDRLYGGDGGSSAILRQTSNLSTEEAFRKPRISVKRMASRGIGTGGRQEGRLASGAGQPARLGLHAWKLELPHPGTGERTTFTAPPPPFFDQMAQGLQQLSGLHWARQSAANSEREGPQWLLELAVARRAPLASDPATSIYRLVNGAGDGLPGLVVDRYGVGLVVSLYDETEIKHLPSKGLKVLGAGVEQVTVQAIAETLLKASGAQAAYVRRRPKQASRITEEEAAVLAPAEPEVGTALGEYVAYEDGLAYLMRPGEGWNPGLFPDMREMRGRIRAWAEDKQVLNCFAYTCGFGVAAMAGGARRVLNLDLSRGVLERGEANYRANGLRADPHDFVYGDAFDWLNRLAKRGTYFDLVILDPPGFARTKTRHFSAAHDYGELAALAARVTSPNGLLIAACNVAELPWRAFRDRVLAGLTSAGRATEVTGVFHAPSLDFPLEAGRESPLKILVTRIN